MLASNQLSKAADRSTRKKQKKDSNSIEWCFLIRKMTMTRTESSTLLSDMSILSIGGICPHSITFSAVPTSSPVDSSNISIAFCIDVCPRIVNRVRKLPNHSKFVQLTILFFIYYLLFR